MDVVVKSEPIDCEKDVKEERELIIEEQWLPTKFEDEENEYYQEFVGEGIENNITESDVKSQSFTIEYLNESDDCDDDDYAESEIDENTSVENYSNEEESQEDVSRESSSVSKILYNLEFKKWLDENFIYRECPVCNERFTNYNLWRYHMYKHKEVIEESESNYYFSNKTTGICKKCNQEFITKLSRYEHLIGHSEDGFKLNIFNTICKICRFNSKRLLVRKHVIEQHPDVIKDFKTSGAMRTLNCPLCSNTYIKQPQLCYHFMDAHPKEYKSKIRYECHLCLHDAFTDEEVFLQHLIEKHELNSWQVLNYRKALADKEYFACTKCDGLYFQNDIYKLLRHFFHHDKNFRWSCKFCSRTYSFKHLKVTHLCFKMLRYYQKERHCKKSHVNEEKNKWKIQNVQEFEKHIAHVCSFCNKEFAKIIDWQQHLRLDHEIDTLKGLEMKLIADDGSKLKCTFCHIVVTNSPQQLHEHRFQHLPYKPYKCLSCSKALSNFKVAISHIQVSCKDDDMLSKKMYIPIYNIRSNLEIQCSYCNYKKFKDSRSLFKHYKEDHNNFQNFFVISNSESSATCKICQKKCEKSVCFEHVHNHFEEKSFKCKLCQRSYSTYRKLYEHMFRLHCAETITKEPSNADQTDELSFLSNKDDKIKNVNKLHQSNKVSINTHEYAEFVKYACPECNEDMTTKQDWQTHVETEHNFFDKSNLCIKEADGTLKCPTCNKAVKKKGHQQRHHKLTHMPYKSFICNLCYARFNTLTLLYYHVRRTHFAKGTFNCYICREVLQTEHQRTVHLKEKHPRNEWPKLICLICYKVFATKAKLKGHITIHEADRTYPCDICGAKVVLSKYFKQHMDRHQMRGEVKQKVVGGDHNSDTITIANVRNNTETTAAFGAKEVKKRKYLTRSSALKKKKVDAE